MPARAAILAAAGSGKSTEVVKRALAATGGRVLLVTFTIENQRRLEAKLRETAGLVPEHISVVGWYSFLIGQCIKPYQRALTGAPFTVRGLNFLATPPRFEKKDSPRFFLDGNCDLYKDRLSQLAVQLNALTDGAVVNRISAVYQHILVDEIQDCGCPLPGDADH